MTRKYAPQLAAVALLAVAWTFTGTGGAAPAGLGSHFKFRTLPLPVVTQSDRTIREVRPSLKPIAAWISSVGAAVALHDFDGDGLSNDVVYVDTRSDEVVVAPVPGTRARFAPFDLQRAPGCAKRNATAPMGVLPADVNEDGLTDALVYYWGRSPLVYVRRASSVTAASFRCEELLAQAEEWYSNAGAFADFDGDGHADLVIGNYFRDRSGVLDPRSHSKEMEMQDSMSRAFNGGANRLLLWTPRGFRDVPDAFPRDVAHAWTLALGAHDLDGDLLPELYFANDFGPDRLLRNRSTPGRVHFEVVEGRKRFTDPRSKVLGRDSFKGMGIDFADLNGDRIPDFAVSNITDDFALEESTFLFVSDGDTYRDESERYGVARGGWNWDARFGDFDNDGTPELLQASGFVRGGVSRWPELHELAMTNDTLLRNERNWPMFASGSDLSGDNGNPFYVQGRDGRYHDVAKKLGFARGTMSRGIATADVDGDGDLDFAVANQWEPSMFLRNETRGGRSLVLHLVLAGTPAIGASATVFTGNKQLTAQVDGGNGHSGKRAPEVHFGLGDAKDALVEIRWRDRRGNIQRHRLHLGHGVWTVLLDDGVANAS